MGALSLKLDMSPLSKAISRLAKTAPAEAKNALNRTARIARNEFVAVAVAEIGLRSARQVGSTATAELSLASPDRLETTFRPSSKTLNMGELKFTGGRRHQILTVATHHGKAFDKGFVIKRGGRAKLVERIGHGKAGIKGLRTTKLSTLMAQDDSNARAAWKNAAYESLAVEAERGVETAFRKAGF